MIDTIKEIARKSFFYLLLLLIMLLIIDIALPRYVRWFINFKIYSVLLGILLLVVMILHHKEIIHYLRHHLSKYHHIKKRFLETSGHGFKKIFLYLKNLHIDYRKIISYLFQGILILYLLFLLVDQIFADSIVSKINANYILIIVILCGVFTILFPYQASKKHDKNWKDYVFISILAIAGFVIIKYKTAQLGWLSWVISIIAGILIYLLSILILSDDDAEDNIELPKIFKNKIMLIITIIAILLLITAVLVLLSSLSFLQSARIVFGSIYVLFLPGFIITYIFFPRVKHRILNKHTNELLQENKGIDFLERMALSFALSIAIVPLMVFYLNLIGLKITAFNVVVIVAGIIMVACITLFFIKRKK